MIKLINRHRDELALIMIVLVGLLAIANLAKSGWIKWNWFAEHKEALDGLSTVLAILAVTFGALATYHRFFKGRTFTTRADLELKVTVHPHGSQRTLHAIVLALRNAGTLPVWNPRPLISVQIHGPDGTSSVYDITEWYTPHNERSEEQSLSVVDTGETTSFFATHPMDRSVWSVTYIASVRDDDRNVWRTGVTVTNS
jgi:hypothetical protein